MKFETAQPHKGNSGGNSLREPILSSSVQSPPTTIKLNRKREIIQHTSRFVQPQAVQLSPGLVMSSQVSNRQKKDLAKYYTSLLGSKEQGSVNAYMQVSSENTAQAPPKKKKKVVKKKRAVSHAAPNKFRGSESQKNLLTIEQDREMANG